MRRKNQVETVRNKGNDNQVYWTSRAKGLFGSKGLEEKVAVTSRCMQTEEEEWEEEPAVLVQRKTFDWSRLPVTREVSRAQVKTVRLFH